MTLRLMTYVLAEIVVLFLIDMIFQAIIDRHRRKGLPPPTTIEELRQYEQAKQSTERRAGVR